MVEEAREQALGLFVDASFGQESSGEGRVLCGSELLGFMRFASAVGAPFRRFAVIARGSGAAGATHPLPAGVELVPLPGYPSLRALGAVAQALPETVRRMWRALDDLDVVWVSGVNPMGLVLAGLATIRRRRVVLLIRQDSPAYFRARLPDRRWAPLLAPLAALDVLFRALARRLPVTVVGAEVARRYGAPRPGVLEMRVTLLERRQLATAARAGEWQQPARLLTVGRIEPEKNPLAVARALELLTAGGGDYRWTWAGDGRLTSELRAAADRAGVGGRLELPGFIPFGEELLSLYREADAFVHVSLTEGLPGVILEAMGAGLPIVATDTGGVKAALGGGEAGLLVPPGDPQALANAIECLASDGSMRDRLASAALRRAEAATIETESERVTRFIAAGGAP